MPIYAMGNPVAAAAAVLAWIGIGVVMATSRRAATGDASGGARRDLSSLLGIALQSIGIAAAWFGQIRISPRVTSAVVSDGAPAAALALLSLALFIWAAAAMGANWSLVARTRADHKLVRDGPFALMRHPIYVALFGMLAATAIALGHAPNLIVAAPLYIVGTLMRVGSEEKLLRVAFGEAYEAYARRVKRFIPGIW